MIRTATILALIATAALAGCDSGDNTLTQRGPADPMADTLANAAPVELPPAILASKSYRCKDNSVVFIDWLNDNKTANFRATKDGTPTQLASAETGQPYIAEGYSLTGNATGSTVTLARPGKGSQSCKG